jgi:hypothetical protein
VDPHRISPALLGFSAINYLPVLLSLTPATGIVNENAGTLGFTVVRTGDLTSPLVVNLAGKLGGQVWIRSRRPAGSALSICLPAFF